MIYYRLTRCIELLTVGDFPQIQTHDYAGNDNDLNCVLDQPFHPLPLKYKVPIGFLSMKAKRTDFISDSAAIFGLLVSDRVKLFLEKYRLRGISFVPTSIQQRGNSYPYWYAIPIDKGYDLIDIEKTRIVQFADLMKKSPVATIQPGNIEETTNLLDYSDPTLSDLTIYHISQTQLKPNLQVDLFCLAKFNHNTGIYVSEHLYEALMTEGFSGLSRDKEFCLVSPDPIS